MKNREILLANILLGLVAIVFASIAFNIFSNQSLSDIVRASTIGIIKEESISPIFMTTCSEKAALELDASGDQSLETLGTYQDYCGSFVTDEMMLFTSFPYSESSAIDMSRSMSATLKQFYANGISPIVIVEPYVKDDAMEYRDFIDGVYDFTLDEYFKSLKSYGVTDGMMGMWVPFPESNTPNWANKDTEPADFALVVNKYFRVLKRYFPGAETSILLNATTYEPTDIDWNNGDYISLTPYLINIDRSLVDTLGIQGFPWKSPANINGTEIFRATEFIQPDIVISAAQELRTKDIWINTGSFYSKYTNNDEKIVTVSLVERKGILNGILEVAKYIKNYQLNEYRVSINLFSEDKSDKQEATDWSYFQNDDSLELLKEFLANAEQQGIPVSIFDN